jgi:hypothetical protein
MAGVEERISAAEEAIRELGFELRYVEFCEDAETPGLLGAYGGVTLHEKRKVKVKTHGVSRAELADVLEHELRHVRDPLWDCGSGGGVLGQESGAARRRRELEAQELVIRTARKAWTCEGCGAAIEPGERHLEYRGEAHAYESGSRYCAVCAENVWGLDAAYFPPAA